MKIHDKCHSFALENKDLPNSKSLHFSFLVKRNTIVSVGWNDSFKTHPLALTFGHRFNSIHSELAVIKNFPYPPKELEKYKLINVRITKNGGLGNAKPCLACGKLLGYFGIEDVTYSTKRGFKNGRISKS